MSRLIDADELLEKQTVLNEYDEDGWDWPVSVVLVEDIKSAPTINPDDLRPRGRWEPILDSVWNLPNPVLNGWRCSECGRTENNKEPYCNCGAKMEETK